MSQPKAIAQAFLESFYGDAVSSEARFALFTKHNRSHKWLSGLQGPHLEKLDTKKDTYFTMGLYPRGITRRKADNVVGIRAVWLDVDCGDKGTGQNYFPTPEDALEWVQDALAGKWSYIIHSGGGLHVYLMLDETLWIETEEDRVFAKKLVRQYWSWANDQCKYDIDALTDLSRIMRLPGTTHTGKNNLCHVVDESGIYVVAEDLADLLPDVELNETSQLSELDGEVDLEELKKKVQMLRETDKTFDDTWMRRRRFQDKSPSGYCMSIANQMAIAGFKDGEIVGALKLWRSSQTDAVEKPDDWYRATVGKAKSRKSEDVLAQRVEEAVQVDDEDVKKTQISAVFGKKFESITKHITPEYKGKKEKATYRIKFEEGNLVVPNTHTLLSQNLMKTLAFEEAEIVIAYLKPAKWNNFLELLLQVMEITEGEIEGNLAFNIEQELKAFIKKKTDHIQSAEDLSGWDPMKILVEDDIVYFAWPTFKMHLASAGYNVSNRELADLLKQLGCKSRQFNNKERTRLWCAPEGLV